MSMMEEGKWMSLVEYALENNTSLSTLRRRIKSGKVRYQKIRGKYFVMGSHTSDLTLKDKITLLERQISDQETLIQILEEQLRKKSL